MSDKKLKAYQWDDELEGTSIIVYAETAGKARSEIADSNDSGLRFTEIRVYRAPWADEYGDWNKIPPEVLLDHGWYLPCCCCGKYAVDDEDVTVVGGKVYCRDCYKEMNKNDGC